MVLSLLFLFLLLGQGSAAADETPPLGAVVLVVDGLGSSYIYPEYRAYSLDGSALGGIVLFNLTGDAARVLEMRVPVPVTAPGHSVLVTGCSGADERLVGSASTFFDLARESGYLCLAILERGDFMEMLLEQDLVLYLESNSIRGAEPVLGARSGAPEDLRHLLEAWRERFGLYTGEQGLAGYAGYNRWAIDAACDLVQRLDRPFVLMVNVGAVDSAGHNLGFDGYQATIAALDAPLGLLVEACRERNAALIVTADHGMAFPEPKGKGGHASARYYDRLESRRVPFAAFGPGIDELNLGGTWSQADAAPTILAILGLPGNLSGSDGHPMPLLKRYSLKVICPEEVAVYRESELAAEDGAGWTHLFKGLEMGMYTVKAGQDSVEVCLIGDMVVDLTRTSKGPTIDMRKLIGLVLLLAINITGIIIIIRIIRE
jgi:hypothetical protein